MSRIVDRRPNGRHKSAVNRQRFMRRFKKQIQEAVTHAITGRSIKHVDASGEKITIPAKDISEPSFNYAKGGRRNIVLPGNKEYISGDHIKRSPSSGQSGQGGQASQDGEGMDDFVFEISREEFLEIFFEELALPNLIKTQITKIPAFKNIRAGYTSEGTPGNINIIRSLKGAKARKISLQSPHKKKIAALELEIEEIESQNKNKNKKEDRLALLYEQLAKLKSHVLKIPFIDPFDIKYNNRIRQPKPKAQAVMFCLMDVSGSMDEAKKDIAKRFFILLYLFLNKNYESVEVIFIRHHTSAKEVDEQEFFYSRETGGTVVSSALELMSEIIEARYPSQEWNIYAAQASDGDNWNNDSPKCHDILVNAILPCVQYFAYVEIMPRHHQSLWEVYLNIKEKYPQFAMQEIEEFKDIYPVFRSLFKRDSRVGT